MDGSNNDQSTPVHFPDEATVLIITRGPDEREKRFSLWVDLNFQDSMDFDAWYKNDHGGYDKKKLETWLDYHFPVFVHASRIITLNEALRLGPDTVYRDARSFLKENDHLEHSSKDSSNKEQPPPVKFPDEADVLIITRGPDEREKRFALWVDLNFQDSRDFDVWFKNDLGEYDKKKLEIWLRHHFPEALRVSRIITLKEALRQGPEKAYTDARSYLRESDQLHEERRDKFEDVLKHLIHRGTQHTLLHRSPDYGPGLKPGVPGLLPNPGTQYE